MPRCPRGTTTIRWGIASSRRKKTVSRDRSRSSVTTTRIGRGRLLGHASALSLLAAVDRSRLSISRCPTLADHTRRRRPCGGGDQGQRPPDADLQLSRASAPGSISRRSCSSARARSRRVACSTGCMRSSPDERAPWRDQRLGRQPRAGARVGARRPRSVDALVVMWQGASERQDRRDARVRSRRRPRGRGPGRGVRAARTSCRSRRAACSCTRSTTRS